MDIPRRKFLALLAGFPALGLASRIRAETAPAEANPLLTTELAVGGFVEQARALNLAELRAMPVSAVPEVQILGRDGRVMATKSGYRGVRLVDVLDRFKVRSPDHNSLKRTVILAKASDGYTVVFSWNELYNSPVGEGVYILLEKDGAPLGENEGRIALMSIRDLRTGPRHVRWLKAIEVRRLEN